MSAQKRLLMHLLVTPEKKEKSVEVKMETKLAETKGEKVVRR